MVDSLVIVGTWPALFLGRASSLSKGRKNSMDIKEQNGAMPKLTVLKELMRRDTRELEGEEVVEQRSASSKTFSFGRGLFQTVVYPEPVHFREQDGKWADIDNRLKRRKTRGMEALENQAGALKVRLATQADAQELVCLEDRKGRSLSWRLLGAAGGLAVETVDPGQEAAAMGIGRRRRLKQVEADTMPVLSEKDQAGAAPAGGGLGEKEEAESQSGLKRPKVNHDQKRQRMDKVAGTARYADVLPETDLICQAHGSDFKDVLVLKGQAVPDTITFAMRAPGLRFEKAADGIGVMDGEEQVFFLPDAFMVDDNGMRGKVENRLEQDGEEARLVLKPDADFLKTAAYPVMLDPMVKTTTEDWQIECSFASQRMPDQNYTYEGYMMAGEDADFFGMCRSYLRVSSLPKLPSAHVVVGAYLTLYQDLRGSLNGKIRVHEVTGPWPAVLNWHKQPSVSETNVIDEAEMVPKGYMGEVMFDITNLARKWYEKPTANYGIRLTTDYSYASFWSAHRNPEDLDKRPVFTVSYVSMAGLESYLAYESQSIGRGGTGHVSLFNGNLVFTRGLTSTNGNVMPVSLGLVYNSCYAQENHFQLSGGWRFNLSEHVHKENISGVDYYVYTQGDGTAHYFKKKKNEDTHYEDESGLSLKLTIDGGKVSITDKGHGERIFNEPAGLGFGYRKMIQEIKDALGKSIAFEYQNDWLIGVKDGSGRRTDIGYHNTTARPYLITPPGIQQGENTSIKLEYDNNGRVCRVRDLDGVTTSFTYEAGGLLVGAHNNGTGADGRQVLYAYSGDAIQRVQVAHEVGEGDVGGNKRSYAYYGNVTTVTDQTRTDGKTLYYQFNDYGNVVGVRDQLGFASFASFLSNTPPNKPAELSKLQKMTLNTLKNPGFERDGDWNFNVYSGSITTTYATDQKLTGSRSLKMTTSQSGAMAFTDQWLDVTKGRTYTFSAWIRATESLGGWLSIICKDASGVWISAESMTISRMTDFVQASCTITLPANAVDGTLVCRMWGGNGTGSVYFDGTMLEEGETASELGNELMEGGDFSRMTLGAPSGWQAYQHNTPATDKVIASPGGNKPSFLGANSLAVKGEQRIVEVYYRAPKIGGFFKVLPISGKKGDSFVISGWARATSAPMTVNKNGRRSFKCYAAFEKISEASWLDGGVAHFNEEWVDWQYASAAVVAPEDYKTIVVYLEYGDNVNLCEFGAVSLKRELYGESFAYDDKGNVVAVSDLTGQKHEPKYDEYDNLEKYVQPGRDAAKPYILYYGNDEERKKHLLMSTETPLGEKTQSVYDNSSGGYPGNVARSVSGTVGTLFVEGRSEYTAGGNYVKKSLDARGKAVTQETDLNKGLLLSVTDPAGQTVSYGYDTAQRVTKVETTQNSQRTLNTYTYEKDRLKTVGHNTKDDTVDVVYTFGYDAWGNQTTVKVGSKTLSTNTYSSTADKLLDKVTYGNGGAVKYTYDSFKRLSKITHDADANPRLLYRYGSNGVLREVEDTKLGRKERYLQDLAQRPTQVQQIEGNTLKYASTLKYDPFNNVATSQEIVPQGGTDSQVYTTDYTYDIQNRPTKVGYTSKQGSSQSRCVSYTYDSLGRIKTRVSRTDASASSTALKSCTYSYVAGDTAQYGTGASSHLVSKLTQAGYTLNYTYDVVGNLTKESREHVIANETLLTYPVVTDDTGTAVTFLDNGTNRAVAMQETVTNTTTVTSKKGYTYDKLGQLTRVDDQGIGAGVEGETWVYSYDQGGNILSKNQYRYTESALGAGTELKRVAYGYTNADWRDQLSSYDGKAITYDAIGNPKTYDGWSYTWETGRALRQMVKTGMDASFAYDHNGLRIKKTVNGVSTEYTLRGKQVVHLNKPGHQMHFYYDAQGRPAFVRYNGVDYTYVHNLQGDIIGILDMSGNTVVEYDYDAWGKPKAPAGSMAGTLGKENPFRYRGYVWDEETGLYYLRSRYYSPEWGRFLNADKQFTQTAEIVAYNLFTYCLNRSIISYDSEGLDPCLALYGLPPSDNYPEVSPTVPEEPVRQAEKTQSLLSAFSILDSGANSTTLGYFESNVRIQKDMKVSGVTSGGTLGFFQKVSVLNVKTNQQLVGDSQNGIALKSTTDLGTASANFGIIYNDGYGFSGKAKASVYTGRATVTFYICGKEIELGLSGDALSIGAEASAIYTKERGYEVKIGASALVGGGFSFRIK